MKAKRGQRILIIPVIALIYSCALFIYVSIEYRPDIPAYAWVVGTLLASALFGSLIFSAYRGLDRAYRGMHSRRKAWKWYHYFALIAVFWAFFAFICFPGNICWDTGTSILYDLGIDRSNSNNPYMMNLLYGGVYRLGVMLGNVNAVLYFYCAAQMTAFALVLSAGCALASKDAESAAPGIIIAVIFAVVPFFPLYAMTMGKDSNFALAALILSLIMIMIIREGEKYFASASKSLLFIIAFAAIGMTRNSAYMISVICVIILISGSRERRSRLICAITLTLVLAVQFVLPAAFGAHEAEAAESMSVLIQQTGYFCSKYPDEVTEEEKAAIDRVVPFEAVGLYDPDISDPIKDRFRDDVSDDDVKGYLKVWKDQFIRHPASYVKAFVLGTYAYYCPGADKSDVKTHTFIGYAMSGKVFEKTQIKKPEVRGYDIAEKADSIALGIPVLRLLSGIGIYVWALLFAAGYAVYRGRKGAAALIALPLCILAGCCLSPVNGYFRYSIAMLYCIPIITIFLLADSGGGESIDER